MGRSRSRSCCRHLEQVRGDTEPVGNTKQEDTTPGLIRKETGSTLDFDALAISVAQSNWVEKAVRIFKQYRVLILRDLLSSEVTDAMLNSLQELHKNWSAKYDPGRGGNRGAGRYEMMGAYDTWHLTHLPGYLEALEEFAQKGGLRFFEAIGGYKFVGGHAHLCLAGTDTWQPLHSDFVHPGPYQTWPLWNEPEHVPFIDLLLTLHPLTNDNGALRLIPGVPAVEKTYHQMADHGTPPPALHAEADLFKRARLFPLPAGCGILRDLRIWHGGTPNTSDGDRYTAVLRFYSLWSFTLWEGRLYETKGVDIEDVEKKLSRETQHIVSSHIIRSKEDALPQLLDWAGWPLEYDGWSGRWMEN